MKSFFNAFKLNIGSNLAQLGLVYLFFSHLRVADRMDLRHRYGKRGSGGIPQRVDRQNPSV